MFNQIIIHKNNLISNIKQVKRENPNSKICAMVKANAYGVGIEQTVQSIDDYVDFWGVACFFEAQNVSKLSNKPILIVGAVENGTVDERFSYACSSIEDVMFFISTKKVLKIHLKINSGMNRYGFKDISEFKKALLMISKSALVLEGIFTHFATTDNYVDHQMKVFKKFVGICHKVGFNPIVHADNSFVNEKFHHGLDMVRVGFSLYNRSDGWFLPAVEIKSKIVNVVNVKKGELVGYDRRCVANKDLTVAVVPVGYADGFDSHYIGYNIFINGKICKVLNVCMDCFMIDISETDIKKGDEIFLLNKFNSLNSYAKYINCSAYEIMTKFSHMRAERIIN